MSWPAHYPKDCPPDDATDADGEFFRFVAHDPPEEVDFLSNRQLNPQRQYPDPDTECRSCGLSLLKDQNDVRRMRKRAKGFRNRPVARGTLRDGDGVILHTPTKYKSHHTWWVPEELTEPWRLFSVIDIQTP